MLPADDERFDTWERLLAVYPAQSLDETDRDRYRARIDADVNDITSCVVVEPPSTITLGGRSSTLPVTLRNDCPTPLTVLMRLSSAKLLLPEPETTVTVTEVASIDIPVETRTNGRFPVTLEVFSADGSRMLGPPRRFTVQAGALAGLGQLLSVAGLLILATWWAHHLRQRYLARRDARSAPPPSANPSPSTTG
jgi:hypothetical protein